MQVGLFCSSNKPHLWKGLIKTLSNNSVDWNLCIAGPNTPIEPLPGNVNFIQTNVKPAQCFFIASYNVKGDCIMQVGDDTTFSNGCLDNLVKLLDHKMTIVTPRVGSNKSWRVPSFDHYALSDPRGYPSSDPRSTSKDKNIRAKIIALDFPRPAGSMMYRDTFNSIGIDKNYVAVQWDFDMSFELISRGGKVSLSETSIITMMSCIPGHHKTFLSRLLCDEFYFSDMWIDGDTVRVNRKNTIDPLIYSKDVLKVSQGKKKPDLSQNPFRNKLEKTVSRWT